MDNEKLLKRLRRKLFGILHAGDRYQCPFCQCSFNKFLSGGAHTPELKALGIIGIGRRANARCPNCGSNDRARLLFLYMQQSEANSNRELRITDIAPDRHLANAVKRFKHIDYICGSLNPRVPKLDAEKIDVTAIPYP